MRVKHWMPVLAGVIMIALWYAVRASLSDEQKFLLPAPHDIVCAFAIKRRICGSRP